MRSQAKPRHPRAESTSLCRIEAKPPQSEGFARHRQRRPRSHPTGQPALGTFRSSPGRHQPFQGTFPQLVGVGPYHHLLDVTGFGFLRCADSRPPRDALHGPQLGTYCPTHSPGGNDASGGTWSASVATAPRHQTHTGRSASSSARAWRWRWSYPIAPGYPTAPQEGEKAGRAGVLV